MHGIETLTQGLLLGLSSGITCLATCAPVIVPLFLGSASSTRGNARLLLEFLGGRLGGYLLFALAAWITGRLVLGSGALGARATGMVALGLGALMLAYGILKVSGIQLPLPAAAQSHSGCAISSLRTRKWLRESPRLIPAGLGLFSGLNICPPFVVALAQGAVNHSLAGSLLFFACFFAGTSVFFIPVPFIGSFRRQKALVYVGSFSAILVGLCYLYSGLMQCLLPVTEP
jgi:hypothetical protein